MKMRYDPVLDDFDTTMLGEAMGNGSLEKSLATVNLLTILDENWWTWLLSGSGATAEHEEDANTWVKQRGKKTSDY